MRIDTTKKYMLGGSSAPVAVKRLWDDDDENDQLSMLDINGTIYRVEWFAKPPWTYAAPPFGWVLVRLSDPYISRAREAHNCYEDCVTLEEGNKAWIVDEADCPYGTDDGNEWWVVRLHMETNILVPARDAKNG